VSSAAACARLRCSQQGGGLLRRQRHKLWKNSLQCRPVQAAWAFRHGAWGGERACGGSLSHAAGRHAAKTAEEHERQRLSMALWQAGGRGRCKRGWKAWAVCLRAGMRCGRNLGAAAPAEEEEEIWKSLLSVCLLLPVRKRGEKAVSSGMHALLLL